MKMKRPKSVLKLLEKTKKMKFSSSPQDPCPSLKLRRIYSALSSHIRAWESSIFRGQNWPLGFQNLNFLYFLSGFCLYPDFNLSNSFSFVFRFLSIFTLYFSSLSLSYIPCQCTSPVSGHSHLSLG